VKQRQSKSGVRLLYQVVGSLPETSSADWYGLYGKGQNPVMLATHTLRLHLLVHEIITFNSNPITTKCKLFFLLFFTLTNFTN